MEDPVMTFPTRADTPPLEEDESGAVRVGNSRVLLELVIRAFQGGATPETIVERYDALALADVYAVIAYYLRHRGEVDEYLAQRERHVQEVRKKIESQGSDSGVLRVRPLHRRKY
jgi:uncharacterized protein (DUF433 family)